MLENLFNNFIIYFLEIFNTKKEEKSKVKKDKITSDIINYPIHFDLQSKLEEISKERKDKIKQSIESYNSDNLRKLSKKERDAYINLISINKQHRILTNTMPSTYLWHITMVNAFIGLYQLFEAEKMFFLEDNHEICRQKVRDLKVLYRQFDIIILKYLRKIIETGLSDDMILTLGIIYELLEDQEIEGHEELNIKWCSDVHSKVHELVTEMKKGTSDENQIKIIDNFFQNFIDSSNL